MAHYRAVMGTTIDCEGCKYDGDRCKSDEGCIAFSDAGKEAGEFADTPTLESIENLLKEREPWMFQYGS